MSVEELEDFLVMRDGALYHRNVVSVCHKQYEKDDLSN
jgi:hypothetical protein